MGRDYSRLLQSQVFLFLYTGCTQSHAWKWTHRTPTAQKKQNKFLSFIVPAFKHVSSLSSKWFKILVTFTHSLESTIKGAETIHTHALTHTPMDMPLGAIQGSVSFLGHFDTLTAGVEDWITWATAAPGPKTFPAEPEKNVHVHIHMYLLQLFILLILLHYFLFFL